MRPLPLLLAIAFAATLLSGCIGGDDKTSGSDPGGDPAPTATVSATTGSVTGDIASISLDPIANAVVFLSEGSNITSTDADASGRYTFNNVAPGRYILDVSAVGYMNTRKSVDVHAGDITRQSFLLEPLKVVEAYHITNEFVGFYECAFGLNFITDTCTFVQRTAYDAYKEETGMDPPFPRDIMDNVNTFYWEVGPGLRAVVSEMSWQDTAELTDEMMMVLGSTPIDNACDCSDVSYLRVTEQSPARAIVGRGIPEGYYPDDLDVMSEANTDALFSHLEAAENGTLLVASRGFLPFQPSVAYQQPFNMYVTAFYNGLPDPAFTAIPDQ